MLVPMAKLRIVGLRKHLEAVLHRLHRLRAVELREVGSDEDLRLEPAEDEPHRLRRDELRGMLARLDGLLELAGEDRPQPLRAPDQRLDTAELQAELDRLAPEVERAAERVESLQTELAVLPRYLAPLRRLLPLAPEIARLDDRQMAALGIETVAIVLDAEDEQPLDALRGELERRLGDRFELVSARVEPGVIGCVVAFPRTDSPAVHELLGEQRVRHVPLPERFESRSLSRAVAGMERRLRELAAELDAARRGLRALLHGHVARWCEARARASAELEQLDALALIAATRRGFVITGWAPRHSLEEIRCELERLTGGAIAIEALATDRRDPEAPVVMRNPAPARPFQTLVRLRDLPSPGSLDPSLLMALFLPLLFGAMVGDVVYGALLLGIAVAVRRRFGDRSPVIGDIGRVLTIGSVWAIFFGFVYGEALGNFARRYMGMEPLWVYRGSPDALEPLILFAIALGATHVLLGVLLGIWEGWRARHSDHLMERGGMLLVLAGVFCVAAIAAQQLPGGALTPAVAAALVGLVLISVPRGTLGLIMGPLEVVGALGNVISYLRVMAVGIASVYLAIVANEFAIVGPLWIGVIAAALLHALNLALAGFTPTIQSLRLHYVEFFTKFFEGGGRPFRPLGARPAAESDA